MPWYRLLVPGLSYDAVLSFTVPAHDENKREGVFMVVVDFLTADGRVLATSRRPLVLRHMPLLAGYVRHATLAVPFALGLVEDTQTISVLALDGFTEAVAAPLGAVRVTLSSQRVHVYESTLRLMARLTGLRYYMYHWFISSFVVGTAQITFILLMFVAVGVLVVRLREPELPAGAHGAANGDGGDERGALLLHRRVRRGAGSSSGSDGSGDGSGGGSSGGEGGAERLGGRPAGGSVGRASRDGDRGAAAGGDGGGGGAVRARELIERAGGAGAAAAGGGSVGDNDGEIAGGGGGGDDDDDESVASGGGGGDDADGGGGGDVGLIVAETGEGGGIRRRPDAAARAV